MIREILNQRHKTHGDFAATAACSQDLKAILGSQPNWSKLSAAQAEALEMVMVKLARLLNGDHAERDHLTDAIGYLQLALDDMTNKEMV